MRVTSEHDSGAGREPARAINVGSDAPRAPGFPPSRKELLLIFGFWTFLAVLTAANRLLGRPPAIQPVTTSAPIALAFIESYLWALLTIPIFWLTSRLGLERGYSAPRLLVLLAVGVVIAVCMDAISFILRVEMFGFPFPGSSRTLGGAVTGSMRRFFFLNDLIIYMAIVAAGIARDYFLRYQIRQEEAVLLQARAAQLQAQLAQARLEVLRTQLNPHFLFNTLHAVSSLVERDPRGVRRMISRLSELLRYTLDGNNEQEVPLKEELDLLRRYIEIMQVRFQGKLDVQTSIDDDAAEALVPNLILQPLLENAIKHGVSNVAGNGRIELSAQREGTRLVLRVRDNGAGEESGAEETTPADTPGGVGLRNTRERLSQLYGADQSFTLTPGSDGGMIAEIRLPYHTASDVRAAADDGRD
jgi:two-component system LytT family sensor kinase